MIRKLLFVKIYMLFVCLIKNLSQVCQARLLFGYSRIVMIPTSSGIFYLSEVSLGYSKGRIGEV